MKHIKRAIKRWLYKRELECWRNELLSLELTLEYCHEVPKEKVQPYLDAVHECWKVIDGLKVLLEHNQPLHTKQKGGDPLTNCNKPHQPNEETMRAIKAGNNGEVTTHTSVDEVFESAPYEQEG